MTELEQLAIDYFASLVLDQGMGEARASEHVAQRYGIGRVRLNELLESEHWHSKIDSYWEYDSEAIDLGAAWPA